MTDEAAAPPQDPVTHILISSLARIEGKVDQGMMQLNTKLDTKADKADVVKLDSRLDEHHRRLEKVEDVIQSDKLARAIVSDETAVRVAGRQRTVQNAIGLLAAVGALGGLLAFLHVGI